MIVYVYTEAVVPNDGYASIMETKVFMSLQEAKDYLKESVNRYCDYEQGWTNVFDEPYFANLIHTNEEQVTMAIEEHEI